MDIYLYTKNCIINTNILLSNLRTVQIIYIFINNKFPTFKFNRLLMTIPFIEF